MVSVSNEAIRHRYVKNPPKQSNWKYFCVCFPKCADHLWVCVWGCLFYSGSFHQLNCKNMLNKKHVFSLLGGRSLDGTPSAYSLLLESSLISEMWAAIFWQKNKYFFLYSMFLTSVRVCVLCVLEPNIFSICSKWQNHIRRGIFHFTKGTIKTLALKRAQTPSTYKLFGKDWAFICILLQVKSNEREKWPNFA